MLIKPRATTDRLYSVPDKGKAEIVNEDVVRMSPTGGRPGRAATKIAARLVRHEEENGGGYAFGHNVGFLVDLPHRASLIDISIRSRNFPLVALRSPLFRF